MGIRTIVKELSITEKQELKISVAVYVPEYRKNMHAPRIELKFQNEEDQRRYQLSVDMFVEEEGGKAIAYATYVYQAKYIFWDSRWQTCSLQMDISYDNVGYNDVPLEVEFPEALDKKVFDVREREIQIKLPVICDCRLEKEPNRLQTVLAVLLRGGNFLIGLVLLPWFALDTLAILYLHTEPKDVGIIGTKRKQFISYTAKRYLEFGRNEKGLRALKRNTAKLLYDLCSAFHPNKKGVLFLSVRRNDLTGNFEYVEKYLKEDESIKRDYWLWSSNIGEAGFGSQISLVWKMAKAKVILIDDYVPFLEMVQVSKKTKIIQLWHACGAFKTFGFSRIGKSGGPKQSVTAHRCYDYAVVSSRAIAKYYAEGFGIAEKKVLPYGVPRTDVFFQEAYRKQIRERLYTEYPDLKGKKVILFAPTFRGNGKNSAYYEKKRFNPNELIENLSEEYVLLIKHHPFVKQKSEIAEEYQHRIFDFSDKSEINDLLMITDLLITDYSSVVYEASILDIPMLFYAYDLQEYIATRDFYSDYEKFVPGKIVTTQNELLMAIKEQDFEQEKVREFCKLNFDIQDGKASQRVAELVRKLLKQ